MIGLYAIGMLAIERKAARRAEIYAGP